jgi:hypothetical protein
VNTRRRPAKGYNRRRAAERRRLNCEVYRLFFNGHSSADATGASWTITHTSPGKSPVVRTVAQKMIGKEKTIEGTTIYRKSTIPMEYTPIGR